MKLVIVDSSVLVASIDGRDVHHERAVGLLGAIARADARPVILDCVVNEIVTVLCRRRNERSPDAELPDFVRLFPQASVTASYPMMSDRMEEILGRVSESGGRLSPHDVLILLYAEAKGIGWIATFDEDFRDRGPAVLSSAGDVPASE